MKYSKNELALKICGLRNTNGVSPDFPEDFDYMCPRCGNKHLEWSEYNTFCWCGKCNKDFPTCICMPKLDDATNIYLENIQLFINLLKESEGK